MPPTAQRYVDPEQAITLGESIVASLERAGLSTTDAVNGAINMMIEGVAFMILRCSETPAQALEVTANANKYLTEFVGKLKDKVEW